MVDSAMANYLLSEIIHENNFDYVIGSRLRPKLVYGVTW